MVPNSCLPAVDPARSPQWLRFAEVFKEELLMFRLSRVMKFLVAGAAALVMGTTVASAGVRDLSSTIETEKGFLGATEDVTVRFTLQNDSAEDLYVLHWQTPLKGVKDDIFEVRRDGKPVPYTGRHYKWAAPTPADYVRIPAGGSLSASVELSSVYDMSRSGEYSIQYRASLRADGSKAAMAGARQVESNTLTLGIERDEKLLEQVGDDTAGDKYLSPSFVSCSTSRQSTLRTALGNAENISLKSKNYLAAVPSASRSTDPAYRTWFGAYTSSRWNTVVSHYNAIYSAFNTKTVGFYCDCTDSAYAYVYTNQPYKIHLCNAFWSAPSLGIDSKAGTLVHEMSHFTIVAGTQDYAYGTAACQNLANTNPTRAVNNADCHEYFAETRP